MTRADTLAALAARARALDDEDALAPVRARFSVPQKDGREVSYLCGNSLGLMPRDVRTLVDDELSSWATRAVDGHFEGARPWYDYHEQFTDIGARLVGARPGEVVIMNSLTVNLHLMMVSFYRPTKERYRIVVEENAFPSDRYAVESQARFHGFDPKDAIVQLGPRAGEDVLRTDDVERYLASDDGKRTALVLMGGVNFYSGQAYDLLRITRAGHAAGAKVGFDLAHAAGNLALSLHDWNVDFACFCTYKYLNAGPGAVAGCFVHERHGDDESLPRFAGWWGNDPKTRFAMQDGFVPQRGAAGWQLSNAPVLSMAALLASLRIFDDVGMAALRKKSLALSSFVIECVDALFGREHPTLRVITPRDDDARGCQVSIRAGASAKRICDELGARGVVTDYRSPDVVRVAPVPLYNRFDDVARFAAALVDVAGA